MSAPAGASPREPLPRQELHRRFAEGLAAQPGVQDSVFVFEIDQKIPGPDGCNWYPLASMGAWKGDVLSNLQAFRAVRESLSARYNLLVPQGAAADEQEPVGAAPATDRAED